MQVILLEKIARLGSVGDTVTVKPGFARNFLLPQKKALRATEQNKAFFESKRAVLEKQNAEAKTAAEKLASGMKNLSVTIIRQAAEDGKLYGSVAVRDIAEALAEAGHKVERRLIDLNNAIKALGVYEAVINLHPEVQVALKVNVARNADSLLAQELAGEPEAEEVAAETADESEEA
ncbi:MAG: 50S ribosomal protein L9 [Alphaproteobacteria bacterium]|nr:50S ribosomal protein L9 [Alphaproteobacteria bacterium]